MSFCAALSKVLSVLIPKCAELICTDEERSVVMTALETYSELLKEIKGPVLEGEGHCDAIFNCVKDVMTYKVLISIPFLFANKVCHKCCRYVDKNVCFIRKNSRYLNNSKEMS
jgi:hypothetical protein